MGAFGLHFTLLVIHNMTSIFLISFAQLAHTHVNRILSKAQILWSCSHMNCCQHYLFHINLHILYIHFIKLNLNWREFQESNNYFKSYQVNKIENFVELYFNLNVRSNLNIKPDFQVNS